MEDQTELPRLAASPTSDKATVAIVGLGDTGVLAASRLATDFHVVAFTTKLQLVSGQELGKRLTDLQWWREHYALPLARYRGLDRVTIHHARVDRIDVVEKSIFASAYDGSVLELSYDFLIIASGTSNGFWRDDQLQDGAEVHAFLEHSASRIAKANTVAIVGGGPCGVSVAANTKQHYPDKTVSLFFPDAQPLKGYHSETRAHIARQLSKLGVVCHPYQRAQTPVSMVSFDLGNEKSVTFESGQTASADLILWTIGQRTPHTTFLPHHILDAEGFVRTRSTLQVEGHDNVFAIGDVASTDPSRSSARNWAYRILVHNLKRVAAGQHANRRFQPPRHRWGSIIGLQHDGLTLYSQKGDRHRLARWIVDRLLLPIVVRRFIYGGIRHQEITVHAPNE
jgi:NADH dehydrogenase FAD-containing subunit